MMKQLVPYLIFKGKCKEALTFYKKCLDGEIITLQTFGDSPIDVPEKYKQFIFNSEFRAGEVILRASDSLPENEILIGTNFALFVIFSEKKEQEKVFKKLSEGGNIIMPLDTSPSGNKFCMFTDKYSVQWMLVYHG